MSAIASTFQSPASLSGFGAAAQPRSAKSAFDFAPILGSARGGSGQMTNEEKARATAEAFVGDALVLPILKQVRESSNAAAPFNRGKHEEMFGPLMDQAISTEIVRSKNFPLVDRIAEQMLTAGSAERDAGEPRYA